MLLIVAAVEFFYGTMLCFLQHRADMDTTGSFEAKALVPLALSYAITAAFLGLFSFVGRGPVLALSAALALWIALQVVGAVAWPMSLGFGVTFKVAVFLLIVRGLYAASKAQTLMKQLAKLP